MIKKLKNYLAILLISIFLENCAHLTVKDITLCAIKPGQAGAVCDDFLTNHKVILDEPEWMALSPGWLCMSATDWSSVKNELEQVCSEVKCSYEQKTQLQKAFHKIQIIQDRARGISK